MRMKVRESILLFVVSLPATWLLGRFLIASWWRWRQKAFVRRILRSSHPVTSPRLIVSLSTLPDRIHHLGPTLRCLLNQSRSPDEIVVAVPDFSVRQEKEYAVPEYLLEISGVEIYRCGRDWGPATKFIPVIQREFQRGNENSMIVVVDDDRLYPLNALETYVYYSARLPNAVLCFRGARMPRSLDWRDARMWHGDRIRRPRRVAVVTGCGSYLIKPRFFDDSLWRYDGAPRSAFYMDDIWISGCLERRRIEKYVVPTSMRMQSVEEQVHSMTLADVPNGRQPSNNETIAFFRESWDVFG